MLKRIKGIDLKRLEELSNTHEPLSYTQLCDELKIKKLTGNSKKPQLEDLEAICDFHIEHGPTRYIIDKYYEGAFPILKSMQGKYTQYIEALLCSTLSLQDTIYVTTRQLAEMFKIVNTNFCIALNKKKRLSIATNYKYDSLVFDKFVDDTYDNVIRPIIRDALASMERRYIININQAYRYKEVGLDCWRYCPSDSEMGKNLLEIEHQAREFLGYGDRTYLTKYEWEEFYRICDIYATEKLKVETFCRCKQIVSKKEIAVKAYKEIYGQLNNNVQERVKALPQLKWIDIETKNNLIQDMIDPKPKRYYNI